MAVVPYSLIRALTLGSALPTSKPVALRQLAVAHPVSYQRMTAVRAR